MGHGLFYITGEVLYVWVSAVAVRGRVLVRKGVSATAAVRLMLLLCFGRVPPPLPFMEMTRGLVAEKSNQSPRDSLVFVLFEGFHHCP